MEKPKYWRYLDLCRVVSIFMVVMAHVAVSQWLAEPVGSANWHVLNVYYCLMRASVPLFFMVSGALMLDPLREITLKDLYTRRIPRLIVALLFWSLVYYLLVGYSIGAYGSFDDFSLNHFLHQVINGHPFQSWFLFVMIGLYIFLPVLRYLAKNRKLSIYFVIIWVLFTLVFPRIDMLATLFPNINPTLMSWLEEIQTFTWKFEMGYVAGYTGFMMLGYLLHTTEISRKTRTGLQALGVVGLLFSIFATYAVSARAGTSLETFQNPISLYVGAMSVALMVTFKAFTAKEPQRKTGFLSMAASCVFGVYLVHDIVLVYLRNWGFDAGLFTPILSVPFVALVIFTVSMLIIYLLKKIPVVRDYIT